MIEDDIYRTSTQYRHWSYTPQALAALRANTNSVAAERVRVAIKRSREKKRPETSAENGTPAAEESTIECLTVEEELKIVKWGCTKIVEIGAAMEPAIPFEIRVRPELDLADRTDLGGRQRQSNSSGASTLRIRL